ncbi:MAG: Hsp20/alpha crystallin family protein [Myxococcota bacterium]
MNEKAIQTTKPSEEQVSSKQYIAPRVNVFENEDELLIHADLPGVLPEDLHLELNDQTLTVEGTVKPLEEQLIHQEFQPLSYKRSFRIQQRIDLKKIEARLEEGVATIHLPKAPEVKTRKIPIQS